MTPTEAQEISTSPDEVQDLQDDLVIHQQTEPEPEGEITKDIEIVRVVLLLTGSVQGLRNQVYEYLKEFGQYDWLWKDDKDQAYKIFMRIVAAGLISE